MEATVSLPTIARSWLSMLQRHPAGEGFTSDVYLIEAQFWLLLMLTSFAMVMGGRSSLL